MKTTLLISTYNWPQALGKVLDSVLRQTVLPDEVVIADDGSGEETRQLIADKAQGFPVPLVHVWHEDKGFRKTLILNKAIARATGDYIMQIDGDVVLERHFVADHLEVAEEGCFVCGSRVKLTPAPTQWLLSSSSSTLHWWSMPPAFVLNSLRSRVLRRYFAFRYARKLDHLRGSNMAFWKADLVRVNGYNADLTQWGHEDTEVAYRLHFAGVRKKALKMGGVQYHLYHKEASRSNEGRHNEELRRVLDGRIAWCDNGLQQLSAD